MPAPSNNALLDGVSVISKGMHSGIAPRLLPADQLAFAQNVTCRNGLPRTRPIWRKVASVYENEATETNAKNKLFQGAAFYQSTSNAESCLVASIGGRLFRWLCGSTNVVQDISISKSATVAAAAIVVPAVGATVNIQVNDSTGIVINTYVTINGIMWYVTAVPDTTHVTVQNLTATPGDTIAIGDSIIFYPDLNASNNPDCWMWQAEDFLIVQNGKADPLFFDGAGTRRSGGQATEELPAGCMGAYVQGRVWMSLPDRQSFIAGDLVYSQGFTDGYNGRSAVLKTTENTFLSGGGAFGIPITAGAITAMSSVAIADTSLGQGPLQVLTQTSVFSVSVPFLREDWVNTQYPLMTIGLPNYGATGQTAVVTVNGDLWYRSLDGIRSYQVARRDFNTWVNTPLSVEVEKVLQYDTDRWLDKCSGVLFNNRLLMTVSPAKVVNHGTIHRGLVALDFNNISNLTTRSSPVYDGLWTAMPILQLVKGIFHGVERCFAFILDCDCTIALYELMQDNVGYFDWDGTEDVNIACHYVTRSMGWKDAGNLLKKLLCADLYIDRLAGADTGEVQFNVQFRSDEDQTWRDWHEWELCAPVKDCTVDGCPTFQNPRDQYRTYLRLPDAPDECSAMTKRMTRTGYEFQLKIAWEGFVSWNRIHVWAQQLSDSVIRSCPTSETCVLMTGCDDDWWDYSIGDCPEGTNPPIEPPVPEDPFPGIVQEEGTPFISTEGGTIIRTEDQQQRGIPPVDAGTGGGGDGTGETPTEPIDVYPPNWPNAGSIGCPSEVDWSTDLYEAIDPMTGLSYPVGIATGGQSPVDYLIGMTGSAQNASNVIQLWSNAVWAYFNSQMVAQSLTYSQARLEWREVTYTGKNYMGHEVFTTPGGNWFTVTNASMYRITVRYCAE